MTCSLHLRGARALVSRQHGATPSYTRDHVGFHPSIEPVSLSLDLSLSFFSVAALGRLENLRFTNERAIFDAILQEIKSPIFIALLHC